MTYTQMREKLLAALEQINAKYMKVLDEIDELQPDDRGPLPEKQNRELNRLIKLRTKLQWIRKMNNACARLVGADEPCSSDVLEAARDIFEDVDEATS